MMIERKFKVGDRVKGYSNSGTVKLLDDTKDVLFQYYVKFDDDCWEWVKAEDLEPLLPAIPAGWTPADEPPDNSRKVRVLTPDGLYDGLHLVVFGEYAWRLFSGNTTAAHYAAPGEVLAWREIEPAAKPAAQVRYVVCVIHTEHDTLEEAELHAQRTVESLHVNVVIARVVEEVKPGKPEIIRMEE